MVIKGELINSVFVQIWSYMEVKSARLTFLIEPSVKNMFEKICASKGLKPSEVARSLIEDFVSNDNFRSLVQTKHC